MNKRGVIVLILLAVFSSFASASLTIGNLSHKIDKEYPPDSDVRGWINISFSNKFSNSVFEDSSENSISLIDLLNSSKMIENRDYKCFPSNCKSDYSASNPQQTKVLSLGAMENKIVGFVLNGRGVTINSVKFDLSSNAPASIQNQIKLDFTNNGKFETGNYKKSSEDGLKMKSCFETRSYYIEYSLGYVSDPPLSLWSKHCQRITLNEAPGYKLGAWVSRGSDSKNIYLELYNKNLNKIEDAVCTLPAGTGSGESSCEIDYFVKEKDDYFVCIYSEGQDLVTKIRGYYLEEDGCGFYGATKTNENYAYEIFAQAKKFGPVGSIHINNSIVTADTLEGIIYDYIKTKYGESQGGVD